MVDTDTDVELVPPLLADRTEGARLFWALRLVLAFFAIQLKASLIIGTIAGIWAAVHHIGPEELRSQLTHPTPLMFAVQATVELLVLCVALFASMGFRPRPVGLRWAGAERSLMLLTPLLLVLGAYIARDPNASLHAALFSHVLIPALVFGGLVGITEELVFRGMLMGLLGGSRAPMLAVFGSATLFAFAHLPSSHSPYKVWFIFGLFGVPSALVYLRTGSILGLAIVHAGWDSLLFASAGASGHAAAPPAIGTFDWVYPGVVAASYLAWYGHGAGWYAAVRRLPERWDRSDVDWDALAEDEVLNPWVTAQLQQAASSM